MLVSKFVASRSYGTWDKLWGLNFQVKVVLGPSNQKKLYHYQKYEVLGDNSFNILRFLGLNSEMQ